MNKKELIDKIAKKTTLTRPQIQQVIDDTFEIISQEMSEGGKVKMIGFGTFSIKKRAERIGSNPRTGEKITIEARNAPVFSPGKKLIEKVNRNNRDT